MSEQEYVPKSKAAKWFNDRLPLLTLGAHLTDYPTPKNLNYWWTFGGILTFCLLTQIVTGIATLIVAVVLLFQLRKQNQQLNIQHKDTVGNVINQLNTRIENLDKLTISDPELNDLWIRGSRDWNNLKDDNERFRWKANSSKSF